MVRISLGLDIGVSSVGFSVINIETGEIIELGSRLFNAHISEENLTRRDRRGSRRLISRKQQRRRDVVKVFEKAGLIEKQEKHDKYEYYLTFDNALNPYELRVKGLNEELTKSELSKALYHIIKRRGISFDLEDADSEMDGSDFSTSLKINNQQLVTKTPAEIQLDRLNKLGKVRGRVEASKNGTDEILLNVFPTKEYIKEAKKIISTQRKYYPEILTNEFEESYCEILSRKRDYFVGPGSDKSRTNYGIYKEDGRTLDNLFEELIGRDKIFPDELRASNASYTAQLFNLLNDLNNLKIASYEDGKLTSDDKKEIINELRKSTSSTSAIKVIKKVTGCTDKDISGYRKDRKTDKPDIHSMDIFRKVHRNFLKVDVDVLEWPEEFWNELSFIITLNTESGEIRKQLKNRLVPKYSFLTDELIQRIIDNRDSFNIKGNNKWHRFSVKTMKKLIPEMLARSIEQMTLLTEMGLIKSENTDFENQDYLPYKQIAEDMYNPVAAKSVREALKIVNAVIKKYKQIDYLVVEMPRDKNEDEEKKQIEAFQKDNEKEKDKALVEFTAEASSPDQVKRALNNYRGRMYTMIRLWYQQDGFDLYSGKKIDVNELLANPMEFDIDHIIPQSISFDDSINNKTLCSKESNRDKDQKTPYEYMKDGHGQGFDKLTAVVMKNNKLKNKRNNFLFKGDVSDIEVRKRFIARNLVDTRYSSRVVLNSLQKFFSAKDKKTKISVVRGKLTSNLRKRWKLNKTRETYHHHAIDASVIAATPFLKLWQKKEVLIPKKVTEEGIDLETGEILSKKELENKLYDEPFKGFISEVNNSMDRIKFSHQVDKKANRKISDETIYSTRTAKLGKDKKEEDYVLGKIKDIYSIDGYKKFKNIYEKDPNKFLLAKYDPRTFKILEEALNYPEFTEKIDNSGKVKKVPASSFAKYKEDHGPIKKYSKKGNGPVVRQLKYYDKKLGVNIDITPDNVKSEKKVVLQSLKPWRTDVYYNKDTDEYEIMGIKYSDLKFNHGEYGITRKKYDEIRNRERVDKNSEFMFTLNKMDRIKVTNVQTNESVEILHLSRTKPDHRGYAELKSIDSFSNNKENWPIYGNVRVGKQIIKRLIPKGCKILKVNTDILGNPYYIKKESNQPKNIID